MLDPRTRHVLVVDDAPLIVEIVRAVLEQIGFLDIDEARDGRAALVTLRSRAYGLVISDWNMEPMGGFELLRRIRADQALRDTPFVMMTTAEHAHHFTLAGRAGVSACLVKPFSPTTLQDTIAAVCADDRAPASH